MTLNPVGKLDAGWTLPELDAVVQRLLALAEDPAAPTDLAEWAPCFEVIDAWAAGSPLSSPPESVLPRLREPGALAALHRLRGRYETWLEPLQARQLLASVPSPRDLGDHVRRHWPQTTIHSAAFQRRVQGRRSCLLVGCGALPSTALLLMEHTPLRVTAMDRLEDSCGWARQVLALSDRRPGPVLCQDAAALTDFGEWDVVFVAALAGVNERGQAGDRDALIRHLLRHTDPGTLICLRSANGWGQLAYPKVSLDAFGDCDVETLPAPVLGRSDLVLVTAREAMR